MGPGAGRVTAHLPILQVIVPLLAAPICAVLRHGRAAAWLAVLASWSALAIALALLGQVMAGGVVSYHIGDWVPPIGIEYRVDIVNAWVLVIVASIGAVVAPYSVASVEHEIDSRRIPLFYAAYLLCLSGLLGITITGDMFNVFVFLEISSPALWGGGSICSGRSYPSASCGPAPPRSRPRPSPPSWRRPPPGSRSTCCSGSSSPSSAQPSHSTSWRSTGCFCRWRWSRS